MEDCKKNFFKLSSDIIHKEGIWFSTEQNKLLTLKSTKNFVDVDP